jgi:P-type Cu+ transporter
MRLSVSVGNGGKTKVLCYHCGDDCGSSPVLFEQRSFCCEGCKLVYELLNEKGLCTYYELNKSPGAAVSAEQNARYEYLNREDIKKSFVSFAEEGMVHVRFHIPKMHCSSCIWLLENLHRLHPGILSSTANFLKKEVRIVYAEKDILLSAIVGLLASIGYEPALNLENVSQKRSSKDSSPIMKIGVAGFCFGNIMMLSFPDYFAGGNFYDQLTLKLFFSKLSVLLSLPVIFYAGSEFFISAWQGIKQRFLNIDIPIAFAILVTFFRSLFDIYQGSGQGYLDSMTGIVFFMLIGRYFQNITYDRLSFDRDYRSFFPIAVTVLKGTQEESVPVSELNKGDRISIRSMELIPVDAILMNPETYIDYSFVTGESKPVNKKQGELIYAGGRQLQGAIELSVEKGIDQSYLTGLWNRDLRETKKENSFIHAVSRYFTAALLSIAFASCIFWVVSGDVARGIDALTTVLIVACPCALLLSATFTNGNILRIFGRNGFYLKNAFVIEKLAKADAILFDKTGTITSGTGVSFTGEKIDQQLLYMAGCLAGNSAHPLSKKISQAYKSGKAYEISAFQEHPGLGIRGWVNDTYMMLGSARYVNGTSFSVSPGTSLVFLAVNGITRGYFSIGSSYRPGVSDLIADLSKTYKVGLLTGDNDTDLLKLKNIFSSSATLFFSQMPEDKSAYIRALQSKGHATIMVGDGLNDTSALAASDVGIAVSDDSNTFSPACDAILKGSSFTRLNAFIAFAKTGKKIIFATFILSILYNICGLFFATQGTLSPLIAAILMPASSISIILFSTISSTIAARKKRL